MFGPRARARPAPGLRYGCDLHKGQHKSRGRGQGAVFEAAKNTEQPWYKHRKTEGPRPGFLFALHSPWSSSKMFSGFRSLGRKRLDQQEAHHESEAHREQRHLSKSRVNSRGIQCPCPSPPCPGVGPAAPPCQAEAGRGNLGSSKRRQRACGCLLCTCRTHSGCFCLPCLGQGPGGD